jgi:thioredoxin 1
MSSIVNITDENFEQEVLAASGPVLVDFWAPWCGPCKMIAPVLEDLSGVYEGKIKICKMDVDSNKTTPSKFNIRGIPTLILFKNGNAESTKVGALSKAQLTEFINANIV